MTPDPEEEEPPEAVKKGMADIKKSTAKVKPAKSDEDGEAESGVKASDQEKMEKPVQEAKEPDHDADPEEEPAPDTTQKSVDDLEKAKKKVKPAKSDEDGEADSGVKAKDQEKMEKPVQEGSDWIDELIDLCAEEAELSENFQKQAVRLFREEMARRVKSRVERRSAQLEEEYERALDKDRVADVEQAMAESVDGYLDHAVEQWSQENRVAVQSGMRQQLAEDFIEQLKDLFMKNYFDVPESKADLLEDMADMHRRERREFAGMREAYESKISGLESKLEKRLAQQEQAHGEKVASLQESADERFGALREQHEQLLAQYEDLSGRYEQANREMVVNREIADLPAAQQEYVLEQLAEDLVEEDAIVEQIDFMKDKFERGRRKLAGQRHFTLAESQRDPLEDSSDAMKAYVERMGSTSGYAAPRPQGPASS